MGTFMAATKKIFSLAATKKVAMDGAFFGRN